MRLQKLIPQYAAQIMSIYRLMQAKWQEAFLTLTVEKHARE